MAAAVPQAETGPERRFAGAAAWNSVNDWPGVHHQCQKGYHTYP